jgi:hypothetical protein
MEPINHEKYNLVPPIKQIEVWKPSKKEDYNLVPPSSHNNDPPKKSREPTAEEMTEYLNQHLDDNNSDSDDRDSDNDYLHDIRTNALFMKIYAPKYKESSGDIEDFFESSGCDIDDFLKWRKMIYLNYEEYYSDFMQPEGYGPPHEDCEDFDVWFNRTKLESLKLDG